MEAQSLGIMMYVVFMAAALNGLIMIAQIRRMREFNRKAEAMENLLRKIVLRRRQ